MLLEWVLWGSFGLIIGSFLNVLILRHSIASLRGRSACPSCGTVLRWFELVPVLSWIFLRGACRTCRARISLQYPLVELLTAIGFLAVGFAPAPLVLRLIGVAIVAILIAIAVYDIYHTIIPDTWALIFGTLALCASAVQTLPNWELFIPYLIAGPVVALPLFALWLFSRGMWMGLGDAKLALGIGWLLGVLNGYIALMLGFVSGAVVGVCVLLPLPRILRILARAGITPQMGAQTYTMKSEVPFGPFLICGTIIMWLSNLYGYGLDAALVDFLSLS